MTHRFKEKTNRRFRLLPITFFVVYAFACPGWAGAYKKPVAKINDTVLTEADLDAALNEIMPAGVFHGGFSSEKRASHRPQALEKMIEKELFFQEAIRTELKIDKELIDNEIDKISKKLGGLTGDVYGLICETGEDITLVLVLIASIIISSFGIQLPSIF